MAQPGWFTEDFSQNADWPSDGFSQVAWIKIVFEEPSVQIKDIFGDGLTWQGMLIKANI